MRSHPAKHGEGFDAPPTLERSGSEHRRAVTSSLFGQERGLVRDVGSSLEGGTRWFEKAYAIIIIYSYKLSIHFLPLFVKADQR